MSKQIAIRRFGGRVSIRLRLSPSEKNGNEWRDHFVAGVVVTAKMQDGFMFAVVKPSLRATAALD